MRERKRRRKETSTFFPLSTSFIFARTKWTSKSILKQPWHAQKPTIPIRTKEPGKFPIKITKRKKENHPTNKDSNTTTTINATQRKKFGVLFLKRKMEWQRQKLHPEIIFSDMVELRPRFFLYMPHNYYFILIAI